MDDGKVRFRWKDYRDGNRQKTMTLDAEEFIRRFLIHVLPDGFHRIRYFGFLGNCHRARKLARCRELLGMAPAGPAADPPADYRDRFRGTDRAVVAGVSALPHRHHGGDRLHRAAQESASRFRIHHDPGSTFRPREAKSPARSGWGCLRRDGHRRTGGSGKRSDPGLL